MKKVVLMYKLVLVRHGESIWNKENKFTGWVDVDLSDQGRAEAHRAGEHEARADEVVHRLELGSIERDGRSGHDRQGNGPPPDGRLARGTRRRNGSCRRC